jgi:hypothetical protein
MNAKRWKQSHGSLPQAKSMIEESNHPDSERQRLVRSVFEPSSLDEVAEAVSVASEDETRIYVERLGNAWRWSLTHSGGTYPLLRITARFLRMDYHRMVIGFREPVERVFVLSKDPDESGEPDAWAVLDFDRPTPPAEVKRRIVAALEPR